ncbi:hypothetical protein D9758_001957 [Tetrapyrgos nigripes]|uniref:Uncharacterized protein n=1 Tax=Tetrapyrgos nigripes TaxID=182062 RepID=A0A8H5GT72_9AGAR|nr:hypothetical protein D9758_001957 [Tetrapyrgos nigripes]
MESNARKRKRESFEAIVTYLAPGRTFDRLLNENSLAETKQVIRRKLNLADDVSIHLAQHRGERIIDLEDDDDFDAFCAAARMSGTVDVRVIVLSSSNSAIPTPSDSYSQSPRMNGAVPGIPDTGTAQKRKVAFEDAPSPGSSESQVVPPRKRRKSVSSAAPASNQAAAPVSTAGVASQPSDQELRPATSVPSSEERSENIPNATASMPSPVHPSPDQRESDVQMTSPPAEENPEPQASHTNNETAITVQAEDSSNKPDKPEKKKPKPKAKAKKQPEVEVEGDGNLANEVSDVASSSKKPKKKFAEQLAEIMNAATTPDGPTEEPKEASSDKRPRRKSTALSVEVPPVKKSIGSDATSKTTSESADVEDAGKAKRKKKRKSTAPADNSPTEVAKEPALNNQDKEPSRRKKAEKKNKAVPASSEELDAARASLSSLVGRRLQSVPPPQKSSASGLVEKIKSVSAIAPSGNEDRLQPSKRSDPVHFGKAALTVPPNANLGSAAAPDSGSESSDEEPIIYPQSSSPKKPLAVAFPDIDLEALMRGPTKRPLTLDNALLSDFPAPVTDIVLEDDVDDSRIKKRHAVSWSDSDENDSDSEKGVAEDGGNIGNTSPEPAENVHSGIPPVNTQAPKLLPSPTHLPIAQGTDTSPIAHPAFSTQDPDPIQPTIVTPRAESPIEVDEVAPAKLSPSRKALPNHLSSLLVQSPPQKPAAATNTQPLSKHEQGIRESVVKMTRMTRSRSKQFLSSQSTTAHDDATANHPTVTPMQMVKSTTATTVTPAAWTTLRQELSSPSQGDTASVGGEDQLRSSSSPPRDDGMAEKYSQPLFIASESQTQFPYSQWKDDDDLGADSDDEEEVEAAVRVQSRTNSSASYRRLTDIASQRSLFPLQLSQVPEPTKLQNSSADMYGMAASAYGEDSDSDSDSDAEQSHIPKSRRAGVKSR